MSESLEVLRSWLGSGSINIFGRPFAGKDTQGKVLAELLGGVLVSGGDVLRHNHGNPRVQKIMAEGGIIPSDLFEEILIPYLSRSEFQNKPLILSEVGRLRGEDDIIMRVTHQTGHTTKAVIFLNLTEDEVWQRFRKSQTEHDRGNRADDNEAVLQTRLDKYQELVIPVIEHYRELDLLIEIDGSMPKDEVTRTILDVLGSLKKID